MSAAAVVAERIQPPVPAPLLPARLVLLGTGNVGAAVLARLDRLRAQQPAPALELCHAGNTRHAVRPAPGTALLLEEVAGQLGPVGVRVVVDATASGAVADWHPRWLAAGIHVVTACKLGQGGALARWRSIGEAARAGDACYGDSATVGAGVPVLRAIRRLRAGGDRIHAVAGVLSGSLAWLFNHYDGHGAFSSLVGQAHAAGLTEPDPVEDLSGEDVRRKLLILGRAAGFTLEPEQVRVESLAPPATAPRDGPIAQRLAALDGPLQARHAAARAGQRQLRHVARLGVDGARVGLEALAAGDPLCQGSGSDNRVAIWSDRYPRQPLVLQGPGAGAEVTAAAMLDDLLEIVHGRRGAWAGGRLSTR